MIISKNYGQKLLRQNKAIKVGCTTDQTRWSERGNGRTYQVISRVDIQRVDHYIIN